MRRVIEGRFELVERLGGGGMGTVWRARDLTLHRDVALKEVRPPDPAYAENDHEAVHTLRARVLREAQALARVDHPNVVTIHHIVDGAEDAYPWLVMELVTGGSLQDRLNRGTMTPVEAAGIGRELLSALRAAHAAGIEHRDVKPANVLLRPDGRPVLTDFGIAAVRESTSLTATGSVIGSPDYMAPERVSGHSGGPAADLWSLGMLLYVAVEGRHPLRRASTLATLAAVLSEDVPAPSQAGPLAAALHAVLIRDPEARPDAETFDRMLAAVSHPYGSVPTPASAHAPTPPPEPTSFRLSPPGPATGPTAGAHTGATGRTGTGTGAAAFPGTPPTGPMPRRAPRTALVAAVSALCASALVGGLVWAFDPDGKTEKTNGAAGSSSSPSAKKPAQATGQQKNDPNDQPDKKTGTPPSTDTDTDTGTDASTGKNGLLTPAGIRKAVAALDKASGGAAVTSFSVYPEYVSAQALAPGKKTKYDRYSYRGGDVAVREGPGGTVMTGTVPVDLSRFNWDALPKLMSRAERDLGVDKPTSRYLLVNTASKIFNTDAGLSIYLSDDYGSGYLKADSQGRVIAMYPQED